MKIALAGASGNLGKELTACLLDNGHELTALDSNLAALAPFQNRLAGLHAVDLRRPEQLVGLFDGVETVITTVGIGRPRKLSDYQEVDFQGNLNLLRAAQAAGVRHFVYTSVVRVESDLSVPLLRAKHAFEQELKASGMSWMIIRPSGYFTDIWRTFMTSAQKGRITLVRAGQEYRFSPIHPGDVARFVAQNLHQSGQSFSLGGPEDFTYTEISNLCFELLGKPPAIQQVPLGVFHGLLAVLRAVNPPVYGVMTFLRWASTTDLTAPHIGTRTARAYLLEELKKGQPAP